ncbi:hypothetical protein CYMTET_25038 [Cymbomonas tetramitiformis]|uniref:Uncharacterized protein n=1 Tax=Cymbomonas tetramitiformis TaxID=36881 RepID=A0AAE0FUL8_9CHLO|nr:hypothetical protein CYMTET_25038 [Cymbomonas tetramitiformis]
MSLDEVICDLVRTIIAVIDSSNNVIEVAALLSCARTNFIRDSKTNSEGEKEDPAVLQLNLGAHKIPESVQSKLRELHTGEYSGSAIKDTFYEQAFSHFAEMLLTVVAADWLPCLPLGASEVLFDAFFLDAPASISLSVLTAPLPTRKYAGASKLATSRLLVKLFASRSSDGIQRLLESFDARAGDPLTMLVPWRAKLAKLLISIPDRQGTSTASELYPSNFVGSLCTALLEQLPRCGSGAVHFAGECFTGLCRRGHASAAACAIVPILLGLSQSSPSALEALLMAITDAHAEERLIVALLLSFRAARTDEASAVKALKGMLGAALEVRPCTRWVLGRLAFTIISNSPLDREHGNFSGALAQRRPGRNHIRSRWWGDEVVAGIGKGPAHCVGRSRVAMAVGLTCGSALTGG